MKVPLIKIPDEGLREHMVLPLSGMKRLVEQMGAQAGQVEAEIMLLPRGGNVELTGRIRVTLETPCQRCTDLVDFPLDETLAVTLAPERLINDGAEDHHLSAGELNVVFFPGDEIDLGQVLEDEILILVPDTVCEEDDAGQCICCGRDVTEVLGGEQENEENHPFAKMKEFIQEK